MSVIGSEILAGASGNQGYNIQRSLRFRSSASAYLSRTFGSGNTTTWTFSAWVKRGTLGAYQQIMFGGSTSQPYMLIGFDNTDKINIDQVTSSTHPALKITSAVYRDPSAWYHIIVTWDTTNATAANRLRLYVNGQQVTSFSTSTDPSLNLASSINTATTHELCRFGTNANNFDGYLSEVNFIDGQALTPSSFGQTDPVTGVWTPKKYTGTYGTNGFYLPFSDNTSATTLAYDKSGNGNNWTPNNISTTAGATYDSMTDVPTLTSATAANYCVLNPLARNTSSTLVDGNLTYTGSYFAPASMFVTTGKFYVETTTSAGLFGTYGAGLGVVTGNTAFPISIRPGISGQAGLWYGYCGSTTANGTTYFNEGSLSSSKPTLDPTATIQVAFDADNGKIWLGQNNTWYDSSGGTTGNPSTGANATYTFSSPSTLGGFAFVLGAYSSGGSMYANFGQRPFSYTPPTDFKALNTFNLPDPTIPAGNKYMDATTYTGTGSALSVVNAGGFQPDLVWVKSRSAAYLHELVDSVRGASKYLSSNSTAAEVNDTPYSISAFNSNGFTQAGNQAVGENGTTYVGWQWKESATSGFDIVAYTGNGTTGYTVNHSLGVAPAMIIVKSRNQGTYNWFVYHKNMAASYVGYLQLNSSQAYSSSNLFLNSAPTATNFSLTNYAEVNGNGNTYITYLFSEIAGFSKFGSYTGNGSTDGPFVYCGFKPKYVMIKRTDTTANWGITDTARSPINVGDQWLFANLSDAEYNGTLGAYIDILSNGFKLRIAGGAGFNTSSGTYIFAAFAENPFKYANAR